MSKIMLVLKKELKEIFQQRLLILTIGALPLLLVVASAVAFANPMSNGRLPAAGSDPRLVGLTIEQIAQAVLGSTIRMFLLAQPLLIPAIIAAYSIVGEKNNRTLEPLLAAPVTTGQLLLAKSLAALIPAVAVTWTSGAIFIAEAAFLTSPAVFNIIITPGWLVVLILTVPVMIFSPVAIAVMISSRVNDARTASQAGSLIFTVLVAVFSLFGSSLALSALNGLEITLVFAIVGAALFWAAIRLFQREAILTRWS